MLVYVNTTAHWQECLRSSAMVEQMCLLLAWKEFFQLKPCEGLCRRDRDLCYEQQLFIVHFLYNKFSTFSVIESRLNLHVCWILLKSHTLFPFCIVFKKVNNNTFLSQFMTTVFILFPEMMTLRKFEISVTEKRCFDNILCWRSLLCWIFRSSVKKPVPGDAFVGYHADTAASVILHEWRKLCSETESCEHFNLEDQVDSCMKWYGFSVIWVLKLPIQ